MIMKILVDASLGHIARYDCPDEIQVVGGPESDEVSDAKLVEIGKARACDGVVFLDDAVLRSNELCQVAVERSLSIIATSTDDPVLAKQWLIQHLRRIAKHMSNGPFFGLVSKSGVRIVSVGLEERPDHSPP